MNLKYFAMIGAVAALAACDRANTAQNPEMLKGNNYMATQDGVNIALAFDPTDMTVHGQIVNLYNAPYVVDGNKIKFGDMATTMMMGPQKAMDVERGYFQFMQGAQTYEIDDNKLILQNADGQEIVFEQIDVIPETVND